MAVTGDGDSPLNAGWFRNKKGRLGRGNLSLLYKTIDFSNKADTSPKSAIFTDYFFLPNLVADFSAAQAGNTLLAEGELSTTPIIGEAAITQAGNVSASTARIGWYGQTPSKTPGGYNYYIPGQDEEDDKTIKEIIQEEAQEVASQPSAPDINTQRIVRAFYKSLESKPSIIPQPSAILSEDSERQIKEQIRAELERIAQEFKDNYRRRLQMDDEALLLLIN